MKEKEKNIIYRSLEAAPATIKDTPGKIAGMPIVYDSKANIGPFDEYYDYGCLDNADLGDVRLCLNHDTKYVYARSRNNIGTMRLTRSLKGLEFEATLDVENSPKAKDFYSAVKRGDISGMSVMMKVKRDRWENLNTDHPTRHILEIEKIYEISACTFPAYQSTTIEARNQQALDDARAALDGADPRDNNPDGDIDTETRNQEAIELFKLKWQYR